MSGKLPPSKRYVKLTVAQHIKLGYKPSAKRYILKGAKLTKDNTISERKHAGLVRSDRLGVAISKETYTKKINSGELAYRDEQTKLRQLNASDSRFINHFIPEMTPKDKRLALKWYRSKYESFTKKEQEQFGAMFRRYSPDNLRQAFGSAPRDVGAFQMVA